MARKAKLLVGDEIPLAYHITFGTYGTRLHGDPRGTVDRCHDRPGDPIIGDDPARWLREFESLRFPPVLLTLEKRQFAEAAIPGICTRGGWEYIICSAGEDHVHTMLSAAADGAAVRKWLKRWLGEALSDHWPLQPGQSWWAEGGRADTARLRKVYVQDNDARSSAIRRIPSAVETRGW